MADSKKYDGSQWEHSLRKLTTATEAVENPLYSDGTPITTYTLKGNEEHTGTPSPQNPVMPQGCGERTAQLIPEFLRGSASASGVNFEQIDSMTIRAYGELSSYVQQVSQISFKLSAGTYYLWLYSTNSDTKFYPQIRSVDGQTTYRTGNGSFTLTEDTVVVPRFVGSSSTATIIDENIKLMLNLGSQPLPYEPYGFKIPISSGGVTTNIYLGSTQTVREISKRIFDGTENWHLHGSLANLFYIDDYQDGYADNSNSGFAISNAFVQKSYTVVAGLSNGQFVYGTPAGTTTKRILMKNTACATETDWKTWLADQYAAGTPVTVWYVLATPETAAANEPLMKIGAYADSISNAAAIPTIEGANAISIDTTVQPSEFTATWTGWHNAEVKEKSENLFDKDSADVYERSTLGNTDEWSYGASATGIVLRIPCYADTQYTLTIGSDVGNTIFRISEISTDDVPIEGSSGGYICHTILSGGAINSHTFTTASDTKYILLQVNANVTTAAINTLMLNEGSTALPYAPYWE